MQVPRHGKKPSSTWCPFSNSVIMDSRRSNENIIFYYLFLLTFTDISHFNLYSFHLLQYNAITCQISPCRKKPWSTFFLKIQRQIFIFICYLNWKASVELYTFWTLVCSLCKQGMWQAESVFGIREVSVFRLFKASYCNNIVRKNLMGLDGLCLTTTQKKIEGN